MRTINVLAMTYREHKDGNPVILDIANEAVITHAIAPQPALIAAERLAPLPRTLRRLKSVPKKMSDGLLSDPVQLLDLLFGGPSNFNRPAQDVVPVLRG